MNIVILYGPYFGPFKKLSFQTWKDIKKTFRLCDRDLLDLQNRKEVLTVSHDVHVMKIQLA